MYVYMYVRVDLRIRLATRRKSVRKFWLRTCVRLPFASIRSFDSKQVQDQCAIMSFDEYCAGSFEYFYFSLVRNIMI